ncbi:CHAT domain-containing protein [Streptomyces profundus]|uniref:CHAT domain-containing protein n=1 Tax=Streptomyces profundus TaxID=2867410 RepID=UPI001D160127|nr:CHAT domain-containing protein [Streptomyces sp. MA3_2.13]UED86745.1 CHAT domain-containing protein [Streptomyces sp. MA3_2.13]
MSDEEPDQRAERDRLLARLGTFDGGAEELSATWHSVGELSLYLYEDEGAEPDLRLAEEMLERAASVGTAEEHGDALILLGRALFHRYDLTGDAEHVGRAQEMLTAGLRGLEGRDDFAELTRFGRLQLALVRTARYQAAEDEDDRAALIEEAWPALEEALAEWTDPEEDEDEGAVLTLRAELADLRYERAYHTGDLADVVAAADHYRALVEAPAPGADLPTVRFLFARALMLRGLGSPEPEHLLAARREFDELLEDVAGFDEEPWWLGQARIRRAYLRADEALSRRDPRQLLPAVHEIEQLIAEPDALTTIPAVFLDLFARLLYERAAADDDEAGRERALGLLRIVVDTWDEANDGDRGWLPGVLLATFQQQRYLDDQDPARLADVVAGAERALALSEVPQDLTDVSLLALGWARREQVKLGLLPADSTEIPPKDKVKAAFDGMLASHREGRVFIDYGERAEKWATATDLAFKVRRAVAAFDQAYAEWASFEDGDDRTEGAVQLLNWLVLLDPEGTHVVEERRQTLIDAAVHAQGRDDAWLGRAHVAAGLVRIGQGLGSGAARTDEVAHHLERARELRASGPGVHILGMHAAAGRGRRFGGSDDLEAGLRAADELLAEGRLNAYLHGLITCEAAVMAGEVAVRRGDLPAVDAAIDRLAESIARVPAAAPARVHLVATLEGLTAQRDNLADSLGAPPRSSPADRGTAAGIRHGAARFPRAYRASMLGNTGAIRSAHAMERRDRDALMEAAGLLEEAIELSDEDGDAQLRYITSLGINRFALSHLEQRPSRRAELLARAVVLLEEAARAAAGPAHPMWAAASGTLGGLYRVRDAAGDRPRSRATGLAGLRGLAWSTLLQAGTEHAADAARQATTSALDVASWCLDDGVPAEAVRALDACRGLVLHSALTSASVPESLAEAGRPDLVDEWHAAGETDSGPGSDLRRRVFEVLTEGGGTSSARQALLDPPEPDEIARALLATGADALVYLMPASGDGGVGAAVIVTARGRVGSLPLPLLREDAAPLRAYGPAGGATRDLGPVTEPPPGPSFRRQLDRLCSWAWYAAMDPLLEALGPEAADGRPPKLVLVPMGTFGVVPWHAAWGQVAGGRRHAVEIAEISYAASARLLCEVAGRSHAPPGEAALVVGDPTGDLRYAGEEADAVQRVLYPAGRFLGRRTGGAPAGAGTPGEVLTWLRGAGSAGAVLHLACHGTVAERGSRSACLSLDGGELSAEELTEAHGAGPAGVGLVVLAACRSHVSGRGHNEAYTLATAFLVTGARSVVGSLWPVPDDATSVLMFMTHWFLRREGEPPGRALRRAQLWMLDPAREIPPAMPAALAERAVAGDPHDLAAWAGFTHLGR